MWKKEVVDGKQDWPYSQYSEALGVVILSGQTGTVDGKPVPGGIEAETRQAINNSMLIVHGLGMNEDNIMDVQVTLLDLDENRSGFEKVYDGELFPDPGNRASRDLTGGTPANGSKVNIRMTLSRVRPIRGKPGEPEPSTDDAGQIR